MKNIFTILIIFIMLSGICFSQNDTAIKDTSLYLKNPSYLIQTDLYEYYRMKRAKIVMLGNSITHGVNWNELLNRNDVAERGISGDITSGFLQRLKYVYNLKPKICFIMGGINDIFYGKQVDEVFNNIVKVVDTLKSHKIKIVIQSTLFVKNGSELLDTINSRVKDLNQKLSKYCKTNKIIFLDINNRLSLNNHLKAEHTIDGVHLSGSGYKIWSTYIIKTLTKLKI